MGLRHRSIRLRVGILIAVPVLCLLLLYGFAASLTLGNALRQSRSTSLRNDLVNPITAFQRQVAQERGLALLNLANPANSQWAAELGGQQAATGQALDQMEVAFRSPAVTGNASAAELTAMRAMVTKSATLNVLRGDVGVHVLSMRATLADYDAIIASGYAVLDAVIDAQPAVAEVTQGLDLVNLEKAAQATVAEANLLSGDMAQGRFPEGDRVTIAALAGSRQQLAGDAMPDFTASYGPMAAKYLTPQISGAITAAEMTITNTPWQFGPPPAGVVAAATAFGTYAGSLAKALTVAGASLQQDTQHQADSVFWQLIIAGGIGLIAVVTSIGFSLLIGRGLVLQLRGLRESALRLAHEDLPRAIGSLRTGQPVDLDEKAPEEEASTGNEIEQVRHAFGLVQRAAVRSAVDEARLRRGISDVFRNLAGRSQSLLHRQLTLLDGMERRATEPEQLEDLFRIDHLTTRMRRHAEGLIILSGDTPARGWRQPVPLVDVLRAAVAEVEDYTRVRVLCRTGAAVAGHAVADVIHLLAELAENATVFSPPNTPVRMQGDVVGRGFAIEVEDRGLGISQARLDEINANLASPPQFDLSGSDRLGLFIVSQLARRHDIKVTLRPSVYGGTTAIVLLPTALVVAEHSFERDPALSPGRDDRPPFERLGGRHAALSAISAGNGSGAEVANGHAPSGAEAGRSPSGAGFAFGRTLPTPGTAPDGPTDEFDGGQRGSSGSEPLRLTSPVSDESQQSEPAKASPTAELAELGLPVRVRQASIAPQLRDAPPAPAAESRAVSGGFSLPTRGPSGSLTPPPAEPASPDSGGAFASPEAARATMSALQRGWQLGRAAAGPEPAEPSAQASEADSDDED